MTTSVSAPLTQAEHIFKTVIWDPMLKAGETWIEGQVPFLALPVVKQIDEALIQDLTDALYAQIVLMVDIVTLKLIDTRRQSAYDTASLELAVIAQEKGIHSAEFEKTIAAAALTQSQFTQLAH